MPDSINQVDGKKNSNASTQKTKAKRTAMGKKAALKVIEGFLNTCGDNEAEAIRVIIKYTKSSGDFKSLPSTDKKVINKFMNAGYTRYYTYATVDDVRQHRIEQAKKLKSTIKLFFDIDKFEKAVDALYEIALDSNSINEFAKVRQSIRTKDGTPQIPST